MYHSADLIAEVKKRPSLWDYSSFKHCTNKHCAEKDLRDLQWLEVAKVLFGTWEAFNITEKEEKLSEIKRRWKNIRGYYRKEKTPSGKGYIYKDLLTFLDYTSSTNSSEGVFMETSIKEEISQSPTYDVPIIEETPETSRIGEVESTTLKRNHEYDDDVDEDRSFFLSLLPEMRKLNGRQKMDFKICVMNDLRRARYSDRFLEIKDENSQ